MLIPEKANTPMEVKFLGITNEVILHPLNADAPMEVTLLEIVKLERLLQDPKE